MIDLLKNFTKEDLLEQFKKFTKKGDIHRFYGISDNSKGILYINQVCSEIGFDLNYYKNKKEDKYCLYCGKKLTSYQDKFCCSSHSAIYNNKRRKRKSKECKSNKRRHKQDEIFKTKTFIKIIDSKECPNCGCEFTNKNTKYCSIECSKDYKRKALYKDFISNPNKYCRGNYTPRYSIREQILREQNNVCDICGCEQEWNNKPLIFILDHIDGDASNNHRENLRMVCPNCDSQLDTFKSKNKNSTRRNYWKEHLLNSLK